MSTLSRPPSSAGSREPREARGNAAPRLRVELLAPGHEKAPKTGPVASVHEAELFVPAGAVAHLLTTSFLERVASAYRRFLGRVSRGLLRTRVEPGFESLVFLVPWPPLLRFRAPVYDEGPDWAEVRWDIDGGLLVARVGRGRGSLRVSFGGWRPAAKVEQVPACSLAWRWRATGRARPSVRIIGTGSVRFLKTLWIFSKGAGSSGGKPAVMDISWRSVIDFSSVLRYVW